MMKKKLNKFFVCFVSVLAVFWVVCAQNITDSLSEMELFKYYGVTPLILNIHKEIWMWYTDDGIISSYSSLVQNMKNYADIDVAAHLKKTIYPLKVLKEISDSNLCF